MRKFASASDSAGRGTADDAGFGDGHARRRAPALRLPRRLLLACELPGRADDRHPLFQPDPERPFPARPPHRQQCARSLSGRNHLPLGRGDAKHPMGLLFVGRHADVRKRGGDGWRYQLRDQRRHASRGGPDRGADRMASRRPRCLCRDDGSPRKRRLASATRLDALPADRPRRRRTDQPLRQGPPRLRGRGLATRRASILRLIRPD